MRLSETAANMTFPIKPSSSPICAGKWNSATIYELHPLPLSVDPKVRNSVKRAEWESWPESLPVTQEHNGSLSSRVLKSDIRNLKGVEGWEPGPWGTSTVGLLEKEDGADKHWACHLLPEGPDGPWQTNWGSQRILWGWITNRLGFQNIKAVYGLKYSSCKFIAWYL